MAQTKKHNQNLTPTVVRNLAKKVTQQTYIPSSVYRLQLNDSFPFKKANEIVDYLNELGVEAVYASPCFQATPGSTHGYDVTDFSKINSELGGEEAFYEFSRSLHDKQMGLIMDVVPNHMGILGNQNHLWMDVLENGPYSLAAHFFDVDWKPIKKELEGKVLLPILGDQYGRVLENQEIKLCYRDRRFWVYYWDHHLPISAESYVSILEPIILSHAKVNSDEYSDFQKLKKILKRFRAVSNGDYSSRKSRIERAKSCAQAKEEFALLYEKSNFIRKVIQRQIQILNGRKNSARSFDFLDDLLNQQYYRLAYWRVASHEINYRRFFNINELAAIRMEDDDVFKCYHQLIFRLIQEGHVQGLRIDHPDGLNDPPEYFRKLQYTFLCQVALAHLKRKRKRLSQKEQRLIKEVLCEPGVMKTLPLYVVIEKILERKENLPEDWHVHGTVGYDFLNGLNGIFIQRDSEKPLTEDYKEFTDNHGDFHDLLYDKKKLFAAFYMTSELNTLGHRLHQISEKDRRYRDFTLNDLTTTIREVIACFPVYRTYTAPLTKAVSERDEKYIHIAIEKAKGKHPALSPTLFDFLRDVLLLRLPGRVKQETRKLCLNFVLLFQQLTAPIMAKGLEDTTFYIYNRFISLNEVGGDPLHFGYSLGDFHKMNLDHSKSWPFTLLTTSTHDTKRGEDVRMRLNVISEIPKTWHSSVARWTRLNHKHKTLIGESFYPDKNTEYFIYQTLLGVWPEHVFQRGEVYEAFKSRIWNAVLKSIREAKLHTNWLSPNDEYEQAVKKFFVGILDRETDSGFLKSFSFLSHRLSQLGKYNSLSSLVLKLASPGVVDTYRGTELWDDSLVDPDNRRPVDFDLRRRILFDVKRYCQLRHSLDRAARNFLRSRDDARIKMFVLWRSLHFRKQEKDLMLNGDYHALEVRGPKDQHIVAFIRKWKNKVAIVCVSRFFTELVGERYMWPSQKDVWQDTHVIVNEESLDEIRDLFSGLTIPVHTFEDGLMIYAKDLFNVLPVALLTNQELPQ